MTVDYDQWAKAEVSVGDENIAKCLEELAKGRAIRFTSLFPEFAFKPEETYTAWGPPGCPEEKLVNPTANLGNLVTLYNKVFIPIHCHSSKQDFEYMNATSIEDFIHILKENPDKYVPIIVTHPSCYKETGIYDELFETCQTLYGHYPIQIGQRWRILRRLYFIGTKAAIEEIPVKEQMKTDKFSEVDPNWVLHNEVDRIAALDLEGLRVSSEAYGMGSLMTKQRLATQITDLRIHGHGDLVQFVLENFSKGYFSLDEILHDYWSFLVVPISHHLGGYQNYTLKHLEKMAFLRILSLVAKDLKDLNQANFRLLFNSPGARSIVSLESYKMQVFLKGGDDVNALNELAKYAERHKKETKRMSEYKESVASGNLDEATAVLRRSAEVFQQISDEVKDLAKKEKIAKLATYSMTGGATIVSDVALVIQQGLPLEWKLVLMLFKDLLGSRIKDIEPKRIVEWMYDVREGPWYEKGIPFLYWDSQSPSH